MLDFKREEEKNDQTNTYPKIDNVLDTLNDLKATTDSNNLLLYQNQLEMGNLSDNVKRILHLVEKGRKIRTLKKLKRLRITNKVIDVILYQERLFNYQFIGFIRFKVCVVILHATGLRLGEVANLTQKQIFELIHQRMTLIISTKTSTELKIVISSNRQELLVKYIPSINFIFDNHPILKKGSYRPRLGDFTTISTVNTVRTTENLFN